MRAGSKRPDCGAVRRERREGSAALSTAIRRNDRKDENKTGVRQAELRDSSPHQFPGGMVGGPTITPLERWVLVRRNNSSNAGWSFGSGSRKIMPV